MLGCRRHTAELAGVARPTVDRWCGRYTRSDISGSADEPKTGTGRSTGTGSFDDLDLPKDAPRLRAAQHSIDPLEDGCEPLTSTYAHRHKTETAIESMRLPRAIVPSIRAPVAPTGFPIERPEPWTSVRSRSRSPNFHSSITARA